MNLVADDREGRARLAAFQNGLQRLGWIEDTCPVWPGQPMTAHWGVPDPAEARGNPAEIALAFKDAYRMLSQRIGVFTALPFRSLDQLSLQSRLNEIGDMEGATLKAHEPS
jgi:arsenate reductase (thioredoxin)